MSKTERVASRSATGAPDDVTKPAIVRAAKQPSAPAAAEISASDCNCDEGTDLIIDVRPPVLPTSAFAFSDQYTRARRRNRPPLSTQIRPKRRPIIRPIVRLLKSIDF